MERVAAASTGRWLPLPARGVWLDPVGQRTLRFELDPADPAHAIGFARAAGSRVPPDVIAQVEAHVSFAWLISDEVGPERVAALVDAAWVLLGAGGTGVKIDSSGLAHGPVRFRRLATQGLLGAFDAFVTLVGSRDGAYTCGMAAFGLADVAVPPQIPAADRAELLTAAAQWMLLRRPEVRNGEWFATGFAEPAYRLRHEPVPAGNPLLANPQGRWTLQPTGTEPPDPPTEPALVAVDPRDPAWLATIADARATVGRLVDHVAAGDWGTALVKLPVVEGEESAHVWLVVDRISQGHVTARFSELPGAFPQHRALGGLEVPLSGIEDWAIVRAGAVIGGFSLRLQHARTPEIQRRHHEWYTGHLAFAPLADLDRWR